MSMPRLRSNFSPSRPLQLWFEAARVTSLARDIHAMKSASKAVEGATALFMFLTEISGVKKVKCFGVELYIGIIPFFEP